MKKAQLKLFKDSGTSYGGALLKTRKGRSRPRPLGVKSSMHLVLRSSRAVGPLSFRRKENVKRIEEIIAKFGKKFGVGILTFANVGNHLHFQIQLSRREAYKPFIRAITSAIAMAVTGVNRWARAGELSLKGFWDRRPFTRIVQSFREHRTLRDYIRLNQLEGFGMTRQEAKDFTIEWEEQRGPPPWLRG